MFFLKTEQSFQFRHSAQSSAILISLAIVLMELVVEEEQYTPLTKMCGPRWIIACSARTALMGMEAQS